MEIHPEDSSGGLTSANLPFKSPPKPQQRAGERRPHDRDRAELFRESSQTSRAQVPGSAICRALGTCSARSAT